MGKFEGSNSKVRCADCTKLSGKHCASKGDSVSRKKRRRCASYVFKGAFENREPLPSVYFPPVDKKTMKMMKKLMEMGVVPVADKVPGTEFEMPTSTSST